MTPEELDQWEGECNLAPMVLISSDKMRALITEVKRLFQEVMKESVAKMNMKERLASAEDALRFYAEESTMRDKLLAGEFAPGLVARAYFEKFPPTNDILKTTNISSCEDDEYKV